LILFGFKFGANTGIAFTLTLLKGDAHLALDKGLNNFERNILSHLLAEEDGVIANGFV
jgi:hypothetical protein